MKIETATLMKSGVPRRKVLFSEETARVLHGGADRTRGGIFRGAAEWAAWATTLVYRQPAAERLAPRPGDDEVEVR